MFDPHAQWQYLVQVLGEHYILLQTDHEQDAFNFCEKSKRYAKVIKTSTNETIYCNC